MTIDACSCASKVAKRSLSALETYFGLLAVLSFALAFLTLLMCFLVIFLVRFIDYLLLREELIKDYSLKTTNTRKSGKLIDN